MRAVLYLADKDSARATASSAMRVDDKILQLFTAIEILANISSAIKPGAQLAGCEIGKSW